MDLEGAVRRAHSPPSIPARRGERDGRGCSCGLFATSGHADHGARRRRPPQPAAAPAAPAAAASGLARRVARSIAGGVAGRARRRRRQRPSPPPARAAASPSPSPPRPQTPVSRTDRAAGARPTIVAAAKPYAGQKIVYYGDGVGPTGRPREGRRRNQFAKDTGINVTFTQRPQDSTESLALYQRFFQGQSSDIDVFSIDVVWPGILAPHLVDLSRSWATTPSSTTRASSPTTPSTANSSPCRTSPTSACCTTAPICCRSTASARRPRPGTSWTSRRTKIVDGEKASQPDLRRLRLPGQRLRGPDLRRAGVAGLERRRHDRRQSGKVTVNNPQAVGILNTIKGWIGTIVAARRDHLPGRGRPQRLPAAATRPSCATGRTPTRWASGRFAGQGQVRRRAAAGAARAASPAARSAAGGWPSRSTRSPRTRRSSSSAT